MTKSRFVGNRKRIGVLGWIPWVVHTFMVGCVIEVQIIHVTKLIGFQKKITTSRNP